MTPMKDPSSKRPFEREVIAQILAETVFNGIEATSQKYGVSERTIRRWRNHLEADAELTKLVEAKKMVFRKRWADDAGIFIQQGFQYLRVAATSQETSPEMVHAIAGAMKIASEIVAVHEVLDARLSPEDREDPQ